MGAAPLAFPHRLSRAFRRGRGDPTEGAEPEEEGGVAGISWRRAKRRARKPRQSRVTRANWTTEIRFVTMK